MIELRTPGELDAMRAAGAVVARVLGEVRAAAAPGVRLTQLDAVARDVLAGEGATSPFLGYAPLPTTPPFPGVVCLPVNDVALHGIPTPRPLEDGDLLSVDAGAVLEGWVGDAATTFAVGPGIDTEQGGHGVGRSMHEDPHVPNEAGPAGACCCARAW